VLLPPPRKPWRRINSASLPADLLESEIFGHGADAPGNTPARQPRSSSSHSGALLLDDGRRIIGSTTRDLEAIATGGGFRENLQRNPRQRWIINRRLARLLKITYKTLPQILTEGDHENRSGAPC
jgi:hypothetical protein